MTSIALPRIDTPNQPFIAHFDQIESPLPVIDARRAAADARHVTSGAVASRLRTVFVDVDLTTLERDLLRLEPLECPAQRPLVDRRPHLTCGIHVEPAERLLIARERVLNTSAAGVDR